MVKRKYKNCIKEEERHLDDVVPEEESSSPEKLRKKIEDSPADLVNGILSNKKVQKVIRRVIMKESMLAGIMMALVFFGAFNIYADIKLTFKLTAASDAIISLIFATVGLIYMLKNIVIQKKESE